MQVIDSLPVTLPHEHPASFQPEAMEVLNSLRLSVASTLAEIGNFGKPADVHKTLHLDRTLSRQLFRLASTAESIGNGGMIPSRTSMERFVNAAKSRGAKHSKIESVWGAYRAFENLVETHAGDRATFNSMVSAASGVDEDWLAADLQHRRNAFRAMSHALGVQVKTNLITFIVNCENQGPTCSVVSVGGLIGLRVLRALPSVHVYGTATAEYQATGSSCEPLGFSQAGGGHVLEKFSSSPLPNLVSRAGPPELGMGREIVLEKPVVGNFGSSTLMFGTIFRNLPQIPGDPHRFAVVDNQPAETLFLDVLLPPGLIGSAKPTGRAMMGFREKSPAQPVELQGDFRPQYLGKGSRALATPEIPGYSDMIDAVESKLLWKIGGFDVWRIRAEFPLYQSTIRMEWGRS